MKIKKKAFWLISLIILLLVLAGVGGYLYNSINQTWDNSSTWTTASRVILPGVAKDLRASYVENSISDSESTFNFSADYCYLYQSEYSEDETTVTLRCSLLPLYYAERSTEVPQDWEEKPDIQIILKKDDSFPVDFMGRNDSNFDTLYAVEYDGYPVSVHIEGAYTKPEKTFANMFTHWNIVKDDNVEDLSVALNVIDVVDLRDTSEEFISEYTSDWVIDISKEIDTYVASLKLNEKEGIEYLNTASALFTRLRQKCTDLTSCNMDYDVNPAESFVYYVYGAKGISVENYDRAVFAMKENMFPFNAKTREESAQEVCAECSPNWTELSSYSFPICPIKEVMNDEKNDNTDLFVEYVENFLGISEKLPTTEAEALSNLVEPSAEEYQVSGDWGYETLSGINLGCYYLIKNGTSGNENLLASIEEDYFYMLSKQIGIDVTSKNVGNAIFESTAYTPYSSLFIRDEQVMRYREDGVEAIDDAANNYIEWRSLLSTLILFYLAQ